MIIKSHPLIVVIDDKITEDYPLVDLLKLEFGDASIKLFQDPDDGISFVESNVLSKVIVILDIMFNDEPIGLNVFDEITSKSALVCFIVMSGSIGVLTPDDLLKLINGHAWYVVQRDDPAESIVDLVKEANYQLTTRVDGALEEWILRHSPDDLNKPYLKTRSGESHTLLDILHAVRQGSKNAFGRDMVAGVINLTIDLLARDKARIDD
jgi:hypothetical protein